MEQSERGAGALAEAIELGSKLKRLTITNQSLPLVGPDCPGGLQTILLSVEAEPPHSNLRSPAP
jgi:hypothetical protein